MGDVRATRVELDGERVDAVRITNDATRCTFVVVVEMVKGSPNLRYLTVQPFDGAQPPAQIPWKVLATEAAAYLGYLGEPRSPKRERNTPDVEDVARVAREASASGSSVRLHVADTFGASVNTADKWLRKARDAGLITKTKAGRPRKGSK